MAIYVKCRCGRRQGVGGTICRGCGERIVRPAGYYVATYEGRRERLIYLSGASLDLARKVEKEQKQRKRFGTKTIHFNLTFREVADRYLSFLSAKKSTYHRDAKRFLDLMMVAWGEQRGAVEVTLEMVQDFQANLLREGKSPAYCDRHLAVGKAAWRYTLRNQPNPFGAVPLFHPDNRVTHLLVDAEKLALLDAAKRIAPHVYPLLVVALLTGLRKAAVLNLKRSEVDFDREIITIRQKGDRVHVVDLHPEVAALLEELPDNGTPYFFVNPRTGKPFTDIKKAWAAVKKSAGIDPEFRWHDLRHQFGTEIYEATGDLRLAQRGLGHRQIETTERYAHVRDLRLREAVRNLKLVSPKRRK